ncbi:MAG: phosphoribosylglycinamide formyltransferase 1 [Parcubacteria group bacterium Gr01-1014_44]|nr:MAG: phosphoribosylglycinamide formyltransferase 1 [Parcubacteria group bacterium Gr01-1014_44]
MMVLSSVINDNFTMQKPKLIIFSSGTKTGGGSGFENLVKAQKSGALLADIVAVVSNHENGGVREKADRLGVPFLLFQGPFEENDYQRIVQDSGAEWVALSGWLKLISGLDPARTFNIHPAPLPRFGGQGMYGRFVHEAVLEAFHRGEVTHSAVTMHFVTPAYDEGPVFFRFPVEILADDTTETLGLRVNKVEHQWQPKITSMVVNGEISWDGKNRESLRAPDNYKFL